MSDILCNDLGFLIGPSMGWPPRAALRGQVDVESELYNFRNIRYLGNVFVVSFGAWNIAGLGL